MKIILIGHKKRHGKDSFAEMLREHLGDTARVFSFATPLKQVVANTFGMQIETLDYCKNNNIMLYVDDEPLMDFRTILQRFGTEAMKPVFGDDIWARLMAGKIEAAGLAGAEYVIIPDFRFTSEYERLHTLLPLDEIITINVTRSSIESGETHSSETELDDFNYQILVRNDDDLAQLDKVAKILAKDLEGR